jgi:hypothetical protein
MGKGSVMFWLALACLVCGFIVAIFKIDFLLAPLSWFVASAAFSLLSPSLPAFKQRKAASAA